MIDNAGKTKRMTLLRELIDIPERVHKGDFVLKLAQGVTNAQATLAQYVVTDNLTTAFDQALALVESAVASSSSKATYLHGSFGSGKSHFMAVLYLLLNREPRARSVPELAPVVAKHDAWLEGKRFLLVPFHMIGARDLSSAILGGYAKHVREAHPAAVRPAVYVADAMLTNAEQLRGQFGDQAFFEKLGTGKNADHSGAASGWGDLEQAWDATRYATARDAEPGSDLRRELLSALQTSFLSAIDTQTRATGEGFISMDDGLSEIARHAKGLGYHGIVLFLDELILWLSGRAAQPEFIEQQIESMVKLVEAETASRPIPIVSFMARQRDLRKLIGENMPGAERLRHIDRLTHHDGRFSRITLDDRDLAKIVERRILTPRNAAARETLDQAFETSLRARQQVIDTLLGTTGDRATFRSLYPFSPALIGALVAVSEVLQRERTALKLLLELLVTGRDRWRVGDVVAVGDLWDVLVAGDEPFSDEMRAVFDQAKDLWTGKLRPLLLGQHGIAEGDEAPLDGPFRADARLLKTLLLAALTPEAPELKSLTVSRLVALNHGSIRAPIPGQENQLALTKLRNWVALGAGEIHLGAGADPTVAIEITGVDTDSILARVASENNPGNRARKVRDLLFETMRIDDADALFHIRDVAFKGTKRRLDVVFGNVRELPDDTLGGSSTNGHGSWTIVLDYPFDHPGYSPADDLRRIEGFKEDHASVQTLCWLPAFLSRTGQEELGRLVLLDYLLAGDRFEQNASHLAPTERHAARALLANQQVQLRARIIEALEVAYGLRDQPNALVDTTLVPERQIESLDPSFVARPPVANGFAAALDGLAEQALEHQFPAHPSLGPELVARRDLVAVHHTVCGAIEHPDRRIRVEDKRQRELLRRVAVGLHLGTMHEAHFELGDHWINHFERETARSSGAMTVSSLRAGFDQPLPMGLPREVQDLVILLFAVQTNRTFVHHGASHTPQPGEKLDDAMHLEALAMPSEDQWAVSIERAGALFGSRPRSRMLTANNVADLACQLREHARRDVENCRRLVLALGKRLEQLKILTGPRMVSAQAAHALTADMVSAEADLDLLQVLANAKLPATLDTLGRTRAQAEAVADSLEKGDSWQLFASVWQLTDDRQDRAVTHRQQVAQLLTHDELAAPAVAGLQSLHSRALTLLTGGERSAGESSQAPASMTPVPMTPAQGWTEVAGEPTRPHDGLTAIRDALARVAQAAEQAGVDGNVRLQLGWSLHGRPDTEPENGD